MLSLVSKCFLGGFLGGAFKIKSPRQSFPNIQLTPEHQYQCSNKSYQQRPYINLVSDKMVLSFCSNRQRRRRRRRSCNHRLLCGTVALFISSITTSLFCGANRIDSHNGIIQHHHHHRRRPSSSLHLLSTSKIVSSLRGGSSASANNQQTTQSTSLSKTPFDYIPITALNDYGQSTQLRHAMEAASRYGTPIVACLCCVDNNNVDNVDNVNQQQRKENAIVICSLQRPRLGIVAPSIPTGASSTNIRRYNSSDNDNSNNEIIVHPSIQGLVKVLATRDDDVGTATTQHDNDVPEHTLHTAIVSTGIQSDATFLLSQLQRHFSKFWFRYNTLPTNSLAVVKFTREVLLDCLGYDWSEEVGSAKVSGGVGSAAPSYNENEDDDNGSSQAGRPLGVSSFLLSLANDNAPRPTITLIEANGSSEQYVARAMGVGAQKANELLSQQWKLGMSREEVKDMMHEVLQEVAIERGWLSSGDDDEDSRSNVSSSESVENSNAMHVGLTIACETLTTRGIDIELAPLRRSKTEN